MYCYDGMFACFALSNCCCYSVQENSTFQAAFWPSQQDPSHNILLSLHRTRTSPSPWEFSSWDLPANVRLHRICCKSLRLCLIRKVENVLSNAAEMLPSIEDESASLLSVRVWLWSSCLCQIHSELSQLNLADESCYPLGLGGYLFCFYYSPFFFQVSWRFSLDPFEFVFGR